MVKTTLGAGSVHRRAQEFYENLERHYLNSSKRKQHSPPTRALSHEAPRITKVKTREHDFVVWETMCLNLYRSQRLVGVASGCSTLGPIEGGST
jgi:hypothetical protein